MLKTYLQVGRKAEQSPLLATLNKRFQETSERWGVSYKLAHKGNHVVLIDEEDSNNTERSELAHRIYLTGLAQDLYASIEAGKTYVYPLSIKDDFWSRAGRGALKIMPLQTGVMHEGKKNETKYNIAKFNLKLTKAFPIGTSSVQTFFVFLPELKHAENFAVSSAYSIVNPVSDRIPFASCFVRAIEEETDTVTLEDLHSNSSRTHTAQREVKLKKTPMPSSVNDRYWRARQILLGHVLEHYL